MKVFFEIPDNTWKFLKAAEAFGLDLQKFITEAITSALEGKLDSMDLFSKDQLINKYELKEELTLVNTHPEIDKKL